jgi:hypothetical protein
VKASRKLWRGAAALLPVAILLLAVPASQPQKQKRFGGGLLKIIGSAGPFDDDCVYHPDPGQPYDRAAAHRCLASMLAAGSEYFQSGHIEDEIDDSEVVVSYILVAPILPVKKFDFDVHPPAFRDGLLVSLDRSGEGLIAGGVYDYRDDQRTAQLIHWYFRDLGRRAGVTQSTILDYRQRTAEVSYKVTVGPGMTRVGRAAELPENCGLYPSGIERRDVDDYVPLRLLDKFTKIRVFDCFNAATLQRDRQTLERSGLFTSVKLEVKPGDGGRMIEYHVRGRPLRVKEIRFQGYGLFKGRRFPIDASFPLHAGDVYRRSIADAICGDLEQKLKQPEATVEVYEDDDLTDDRQVIVTFGVMAIDWATLSINGKVQRYASETDPDR